MRAFEGFGAGHWNVWDSLPSLDGNDERPGRFTMQCAKLWEERNNVSLSIGQNNCWLVCEEEPVGCDFLAVCDGAYGVLAGPLGPLRILGTHTDPHGSAIL